MNKGKCYISGKIGGLTEHEAKTMFTKAEQTVKALGYEPVNPFREGQKFIDSKVGVSIQWRDVMKCVVSLMLQDDCDTVYVITNHTASPGATIEINLARKLGYALIHEEDHDFTKLVGA